MISYSRRRSKICIAYRFCFIIGYLLCYFLRNQPIVFADPYEKNEASTEGSESYQREELREHMISYIEEIIQCLTVLKYIDKKYKVLENSCDTLLRNRNIFLNEKTHCFRTMLNSFITTFHKGDKLLMEVNEKIEGLTNTISAQQVLLTNKLIQHQGIFAEEGQGLPPMEAAAFQEWELFITGLGMAKEILEMFGFQYVGHAVRRMVALRAIHYFTRRIPYCNQYPHLPTTQPNIPLRSVKRKQQILKNLEPVTTPLLDVTNPQPVSPSPAIVRTELENLKEALQKMSSSEHPPCSHLFPTNNYFSVYPSLGTILEESEEESPSDDESNKDNGSNKAVYGSSESSSAGSFDINFSEEEEEEEERFVSSQQHTQTSSSTPEGSDEEQTQRSSFHSDTTQGRNQQSPGPGDTACLTGYSQKTQIFSLQGLQYTFIRTIEQMADSLRTVVLTANVYRETKTFDTFTPYRQKKSVYASNTTALARSGDATRVFHLPIHTQSVTAIRRYYPFAYTCNAYSNLECKTQAATTGLVFSPTSGTQMAIAYAYHTPSTLLYVDKNESDINPSVAEEKTKLNTLSVTFGWNTNTIGMTGCVAGGYSWGKAKHIRRGIHAQKYMCAKGTPMVTIYGGLTQLGYNVFLSKAMMLTPYVESLCLIGQWQPYQEQSALSLSTISKNTENVWEKGVGLRYNWTIKHESQLQAWIASISVQHKTSTVTFRHCNPVLSLYDFSVPARKKRYTQHELGIAYRLNVTELLKVTLHGRVRCNPSTMGKTQQMRCILQYTY